VMPRLMVSVAKTTCTSPFEKDLSKRFSGASMPAWWMRYLPQAVERSTIQLAFGQYLDNR